MTPEAQIEVTRQVEALVPPSPMVGFPNEAARSLHQAQMVIVQNV